MGCLQSYLRPPNSPVESGGLPPAPPPSSAALSAAVAESEDAGQAAHLVASNYESPQQKDGAHGKPRTHQPGRRHGALPALAPTPSPRHSEPSPSRTTPRRSFASTAADALHHITPRVLASPGGFAGFFFGGDPIPGFEELDYDPDPSVLRSGVMDTSGIMPVRPRRIYSESLARYLLAPASPQNKKREPSPHPPSRRFSGVPSAPEVPPTPPQCPLLAPDLRECLKDSGGLLSLLTAMESEVLAAAMTRVVCKAGQALLAAGQDSPDMFLVESGAFSLLEYHGRDQQNGAEGPSPLNPLGLRGRGGNVTRGGMSQVLCGRGACFGESNLVVPSSGSKTVACGRNGGVVWTISHQRYRRVMAKESLRVRRAALRALGGVPLLHQLTEQQLRKVVDKVELVFYAQDEQVLKETDVTSSLYVIHSGTARVNKRRGVAPFQRIVTDLLQEGQHFGEMALVTGRDSGMDVKAKTDIMLYRVDRRLLEVLLGPVDTSLERGVYLQCLASIPMLENMSDGERVRMLDLFERQEFSSGESILSKGEEANSMYLLVKGIVAVMSVDELTKGDVEVTQITPVEYFGERALLENDARNAGVVVKSSSAVCLRLDRPSFNGAFGPVRHIMEREENVGSPLPRAGLDLRPMALVAEDQMGKIFIAEQMGVSSPSHGRSTKVFSFGNPLFGPTRRMVRCVPDRDRAEAMKEAHVRSGHHPFIVHFFGWFAEPPQTFLVTEHLEGISLYTLLHGPVPDDAKRVRNDRASSRFYAAAILSALSHLHEREIVFRALRPGAVILDWAGYPRLADFTCARQLKSGLAYTLCGRPDYLAPEAILGRGYDARADYWALGCLIYELIVGRPPFHNPQSSQNFAECTRCILRSEVPLDMRKEDGSLVLDPDCRNLVVELLRPSPLERAGCSRGDLDIRCSSWFENFAWEDLLERTMPPPWVPSEAFMSNRTKLQTQEAHSLTKPCDWTFGAANLGSPSSPH